MTQDRITGKSFATRSEVIAQHGMAATSQPLATQVAIDILKKGGSAVDAAIAAIAALALMEPTGSGLGGDLFAIVWDAEGQRLHGLNASGRSPKELTRQYFLDNGPETIRDLIFRGHNVRFDVGGYGGYQAIMYDAGKKVYLGASESRKDGHAAGY